MPQALMSRPNTLPQTRPSDYQQAIALLNPHTPEGKAVDFLWYLFNSFPKRHPRFQPTYAAARRMALRRRKELLPPRAAFTCTVDYYEAAEPLLVARSYFLQMHRMPNYLRSVYAACQTIVPKKLF